MPPQAQAVLPQVGDEDLGAKMRAAMGRQLARPVGKVLLIGRCAGQCFWLSDLKTALLRECGGMGFRLVLAQPWPWRLRCGPFLKL